MSDYRKPVAGTIGRTWCWLCLAGLGLLLPGCDRSGGVWNNPYPQSHQGKKILYSLFSGRPKHLDPARSYSSNEYTYIGNIYEPPLQYHYLKRPYQLIPLTAEKMPLVEHFDHKGNRLPKQAPASRIASTVYTITIKPGIKYQPHPAFARDQQGRYKYHHLTPRQIAQVDKLSDFSFGVNDTRELSADDYVYQIKRLAHPRLHSPILSTMVKYIDGLKEYAASLRKYNTELKTKIRVVQRLVSELDRFSMRGKVFSQVKKDYLEAMAPEEAKLLLAELERIPQQTGSVKTVLPSLRKALDKLRAEYRFLDLNRFPLPGVRVVNRYTYQIILKKRYPQLKYWLAMPFFSPMPYEVEKFYAQAGMKQKNISMDWYPVGTGAYMLTKNDPNSQMVLQRNPNFRGIPYPASGEKGDREKGLLDDAGKLMPFVDKVIFTLEKESIPIWNKFLQGYYDTAAIPSDSFDQAVKINVEGDARLTETMRSKDIQLATSVRMSISYLGFNMLDPVVGGNSERARKLRQAISIAIDYEEYISIFLNGRGEVAQGPLPPGMFGYLPGKEGINRYVYDWVNGKPRRKPIAYAKKLLAEAGYPGGRDPKTGEQLILYFDLTGGGAQDKAERDWFRKQLRKIDIQLEIRETDYNRFQEKMRDGKAQLFRWGWNADYPDPENFLFLLYGPNGKVKYRGENAANYDSKEFNRYFKQMETMPNSPQRLAIIRKMLHTVQRDAPWIWGFHPKSYALFHAWYKNAKPNDMSHNTLMYKRVLPALRDQRRRQWNKPVLWPVYVLFVLLVVTLVPAFKVYRDKLNRAKKAVKGQGR